MVQIVACSVAGVQVDVDGDLAAGEVDALARVADRAAAADRDAVDRDVDLVGLERGVGGADRGEHPAPVGVVAEQRRLEQVVAGAGAAGVEARPDGGGVAHRDRDVLGRALGVGEQLHGQVGGGGGERLGELLGARA